MTEADEVILQPDKKKYPEAQARIISNRRLQFIFFEDCIRVSGMPQVRSSLFMSDSVNEA